MAAIWWGRAVVVIAILAALATLVVNGDGLSLRDLTTAPHLLDIDALSHDPVRSIWFLHSEVPIHNTVVAVVGWLPVPLVGTLFLLLGAAVLATGLLLHAVLVRWGTPPLAAGAVVAFAMVNPALLATITNCGIEVPVALLVVTALYTAQRYLDRPTFSRLLLLSVVLTAGALTWQVLQPGWVLAIVLVVAAARRAGWLRTLAALAIPVVFVGGWAVKNGALFGEPMLASSVGFDFHQGITGPMSTEGVAEARRARAVTRLATLQPWGTLDYYGHDPVGAGACVPRHGHAVTVDPTKSAAPEDVVAPNYNNDCYLPLYQQARRDALTLIRRYPSRYLTTRDAGLVLAYDTADDCVSDPCTWMDRLYEPLLGQVHGQVTMYDWNLRLFGSKDDHIEVALSMVLVVASAGIGWRGLVALWRFRSLGWKARSDWPTGEVLWVVAALTIVVVIGAAALVAVGDNAHMRTSLDPLLLSLPLASIVRWLHLLRHRTRAEPDGSVPTPGPAPASTPASASSSASGAGNAGPDEPPAARSDDAAAGDPAMAITDCDHIEESAGDVPGPGPGPGLGLAGNGGIGGNGGSPAEVDRVTP